jgi:hypothetical protein
VARTRRLFNNAVFETVLVRDGKAAEARYCEPFDVLFSSRRFEYGDWLEREDSNLESGPERCGLPYRLMGSPP